MLNPKFRNVKKIQTVLFWGTKSPMKIGKYLTKNKVSDADVLNLPFRSSSLIGGGNFFSFYITFKG